MSNLKNLSTNHYKSKTISHKKINILNSKYIGFKLTDLLNFKFYHKNPNIIEFKDSAIMYVNKIREKENVYINRYKELQKDYEDVMIENETENLLLETKIDILIRRLRKYENHNIRPSRNRKDNNVIKFSRSVHTAGD